MAEAAAVRYGMQVAKRLWYDRICLEGDASNLTRVIDEKRRDSSPLFLIYDYIGNLSKIFNVFVSSNVKRVGNTVAHLGARW